LQFAGLDIWMVLAEERKGQWMFETPKKRCKSQRSVDAAYKSRWH
jgi:hypothetical protein